METEIQKSFLVLEIMAFERVVGIYLNYDKNTCDGKSTCYQAVLRFQIWLKRDVF